MRVRITRPLNGSIDGIQLSRLEKGQVYDVYTSLACYLLSEKMAEPAGDNESSTALHVEKTVIHPPVETWRRPVVPRSIAADRRRTRKRNKREEP